MSNDQTSVTSLQFLVELRRRIIVCLLFLISLFGVLSYYANVLYALLARPLLDYLPQGHNLIATHITAPFFVPFEFSFFTALFLSMPFFFYQLWRFVAPALYRRERRLVWALLVVSIGLFYMGVGFAYFVIFPILFSFLNHTAPQGVTIMPDIAQYLDFTLKLFFVFGMIFEIPMMVMILIKSGMVTREQLIQWRPYVIVTAFVMGMLLGPPDIFSQTLLAIPMWLLFEAGVFFARIIQYNRTDSG